LPYIAHQLADLPNTLAALILSKQKKTLAGARKQLRWSLDCGQGPEDCSRQTDQQWQNPDGCTCWVGAVVCGDH